MQGSVNNFRVMVPKDCNQVLLGPAHLCLQIIMLSSNLRWAPSYRANRETQENLPIEMNYQTKMKLNATNHATTQPTYATICYRMCEEPQPATFITYLLLPNFPATLTSAPSNTVGSQDSTSCPPTYSCRFSLPATIVEARFQSPRQPPQSRTTQRP